jgi:TMEM175 potassium channel family protein
MRIAHIVHSEPMADRSGTERGFDRFVNFSDAVVAIAISLLILPVVDAVADTARTEDSAADFLRDNGDRLLAFGISFVVIASYWVAHHAVFEQVKGYSAALMWSNLAWLATIVFLPLPTELLAVEGSEDAFVRFLYVASVLVTSLTLVAIELVIDHSPDLRRDPNAAPPSLATRLVSPLLLVIALVVAVAVPPIGLWALFLLLASGPVGAWLERR